MFKNEISTHNPWIPMISWPLEIVQPLFAMKFYYVWKNHMKGLGIFTHSQYNDSCAATHLWQTPHPWIWDIRSLRWLADVQCVAAAFRKEVEEVTFECVWWCVAASAQFMCKRLWSFLVLFPQQRKLMGSSAQNSSGVHWCKRQVRFNRVPEKVPEKVWEAFNEGLGEGCGEGSGRLWCRARSGSIEGLGEGSGEGLGGLVQSQVRFNKASEKVPEPWCKAKSGSTGSGEVCRSQARSGSFNSRIPRGVSSAWLRSTLQKDL